MIALSEDVVRAVMLNLHDYIYHTTGCRMNYARCCTEQTRKILEKALEENK